MHGTWFVQHTYLVWMNYALLNRFDIVSCWTVGERCALISGSHR